MMKGIRLYRNALLLVLMMVAITMAGCARIMDTAETEVAAYQTGPFTDGEIVAVLQALNDAELDHAELALERTDNPWVEAYARQMQNDHEGMNERVAGASEALEITPEDNPLSERLTEQADDIREELSDLDDDEFDQAYLERQMELHELGLDTVEDRLMDETDNESLVALLTQAAEAFEQHMELAEEYLDEL